MYIFNGRKNNTYPLLYFMLIFEQRCIDCVMKEERNVLLDRNKQKVTSSKQWHHVMPGTEWTTCGLFGLLSIQKNLTKNN